MSFPKRYQVKRPWARTGVSHGTDGKQDLSTLKFSFPWETEEKIKILKLIIVLNTTFLN
jgi:hypothetical protein